MNLFNIIILIVGVILLVLAIMSGLALFKKALIEPVNDEYNGNMGTLWLLFLIGMLGGLLFIWFGLHITDINGWSIVAFVIVATIFGIMLLFN